MATVHPSHSPEVFSGIAKRGAVLVGSPWVFVAAITLILGWVGIGLYLGFSTEWLLLINTIATVTTFLVVFLIQNTENRDTAALHLKLNELIRIHKDARNSLLTAEELPEHDLSTLRAQFHKFALDEALLHDHAEEEEDTNGSCC